MIDLFTEDRISDSSPKTVDDLIDKLKAVHSEADLDIIRKAYIFSEKAHEGQIRRSGDPYIIHPLGVAAILADLHLDIATIATGLLHDTVEDTHATLVDIEREFGRPVMELVDGVTKISKMHFKNTHEKQGENIRKMIVAMGKDVRVILVKLADRLHNMRSLNHMAPEKQVRIAQETLDIYAPLASRLGISSLKIELEDLSFRYSKPEQYYELAQKVSKKKNERESYIESTLSLLVNEITTRSKIKFKVYGRPKHLYSIYKKMEARSLDYEQVYDVLAFRIVVGSIGECYEALGHVHALWKPIPGRFKDFIAMPKVNHYQSLHTTVIGPGGERIEIQIRTEEMHLIAERGIAAHWQYKEGQQGVPKAQLQTAQKFEWLRDLVSLHQQMGNADEFLETVKKDLWESEIYVFTPKGDVRELPEGATPIDFAFAVHTNVGMHCASARVNGRLVPLRTQLKSGDTVEVISSATQWPSKDWLKFCVTTRAKSRIRAHVKDEERKRASELGKDILEKEFRKFGLNAAKEMRKDASTAQLFKDYGAPEIDDIYVLVGYGKATARDVVRKFAPPETKIQAVDDKPTFIQKVFNRALDRKRKSKSMIRVDGLEDLLVRFGKCCTPIPGDPIVGFISRGRGITIHKADCERAFAVDNDRRIDVEWTVNTVPEGADRIVRVRIISQDVPGLLKNMSEAFSLRGINIHNAQIRTTKDKKAVCLFDVSVRDTAQLSQVMQDLSKIKGIIGVTRVTHT